MGGRGIRRDVLLNAGKREMTASRKEAERSDRAREKALRLPPPHAHYPRTPRGYGPPSPSGAAPSRRNHLSAGLLLAMIVGALFFFGTCSVIASRATTSGSRSGAPSAH